MYNVVHHYAIHSLGRLYMGPMRGHLHRRIKYIRRKFCLAVIYNGLPKVIQEINIDQQNLTYRSVLIYKCLTKPPTAVKYYRHCTCRDCKIIRHSSLQTTWYFAFGQVIVSLRTIWSCFIASDISVNRLCHGLVPFIF